MIDVTTPVDVDPETGTVRVHFDPETESPSHVVVSVVATVTDVPTLELNSLYDVIDPDALDEILRTPRPHESRVERSVTFDYEGFRTTITSTGHVELRPIEQAE